MTFLPGTGARRRIYLLRHGAVEYLNPDGTVVEDARRVALSATGREQAVRVAELLREVDFDRVVHSDLPRARETAEIVLGDGRAHALEPVQEFSEIEIGHLDRVPSDRIHAEFTYGFESACELGASLARGEPFREFFERVVTRFELLIREPGWTRMLVVAHGGTNRAILSWMARGGLESLASFEQDECCLNVLDVDIVNGEIPRRYVRVMNFTPYNLDKEGLFLTTLERIIADRDRRRC